MARDLGCNLVRVFTGYEQCSMTLEAQSKLVVGNRCGNVPAGHCRSWALPSEF